MAIPLRAALFCVMLFSIRLSAESSAVHARPSAPHTLRVSGRQFVMAGKPFQIISGEMHYTRIPRAYWRDRLRKARAMGLNTITTYVFWNVHEPRPGVFDFSGQNDIAEFIREAQEEGLNVILRPGPLGRFWSIGPQFALYTPGCWLRKGRNIVTVFDLLGDSTDALRSTAQPIFSGSLATRN